MLYSQTSGNVLTLNAAAEFILTFCDGATSLQAVWDNVSAELPMSQPDFIEIVQQLVRERVLEVLDERESVTPAGSGAATGPR